MAPIGSIGLTAGAIIGLVVVSAFFSSSETALFTLSADWLAEQDAAVDDRADVLRTLREDPHRLLVTLLVGNNLVNVAIATLTTVLFIEHLPAGIAVTASTLVASFLVLVFGEIVPKSYGLGNANRWALAVARPVTVVGIVFSPLVFLFDGLTRSMSTVIGGENHLERPYLDE